MQTTTKKILISLHNGSPAERKQLAGILRYSATVGNWDFDFWPDAVMPSGDDVPEKQSSEYDGIISSTGLKDWKYHDLVIPPNTAVVLIDFNAANGGDIGRFRVGFVSSDDYRAGQMGAQHLLSLGKMRSYGFVPPAVRSKKWALLRQHGMADALKRQSLPLEVFDGSASSLETWLSGLPKPTAIMAASDDVANLVIAICHKMNIHIPNQLVIIGNDNDSLICENLRPRLSSVQIDHEGEGYAAAKMLARMMRHPNQQVKDVLIGPKGVAIRESTRPVSPSANLISRALAYIKETASDGITVDDVVEHVNVSRCLLYLRFRKILGKSVLEAITEERVAMLKTKLRLFKTPITQLALDCGFPTAGHAARVFKAATGMTMRDWRKGEACRPCRRA